MMTVMGKDTEHEMVGSEVQNASVLQSGRTLRTAFSHYAQTSAAGKIKLYSESNRIELFRLASNEWHADIGLRGKFNATAGNQLQREEEESIRGIALSIENAERDIGKMQKSSGYHAVDNDVREDSQGCSNMRHIEPELLGYIVVSNDVNYVPSVQWFLQMRMIASMCTWEIHLALWKKTPKR